MNLRPRLRSVQATGCNLLPIDLPQALGDRFEVIANRVIGIFAWQRRVQHQRSLGIDFQLVQFSQLQINGVQEIAVDLFAVVLNALSQFVEPQRQNNVDCLRQLVLCGSAELPVFDWTEKVVKRFCAVKNDLLRLPRFIVMAALMVSESGFAVSIQSSTPSPPCSGGFLQFRPFIGLAMTALRGLTVSSAYHLFRSARSQSGKSTTSRPDGAVQQSPLTDAKDADGVCPRLQIALFAPRKNEENTSIGQVGC
ncbi:MAG: hypothetical protein CM15mP39_08020 [Synechococcus sp.]|nr:MAG: hypothetical protein CM15mP39_08020 [Synechococcus sp.]